jgi:hypothetical protein
MRRFLNNPRSATARYDNFWSQFFLDFVADEEYWAQRIQAAFEDLMRRGVQIHVIHSEDDEWCPYKRPTLPPGQGALLHDWPLETRKQAGANDRHFHESLAQLPETVDKVCQAIAAILSSGTGH